MIQKRSFFGKRCLDLLLIILAAPLWIPVMALVAITTLLVQGSPLFFCQDRPGLDCRIFRLIKFRTMCAGDAPDATRLTRWGRLLRATSLDELPELFNILRGDMSLVGPRPLLVRYLARYSAEQQRRQETLPGLTGWAQIHGRNSISWEEKFAFDVWYVDHRSLALDMKILFITLWRVLTMQGISADGEATAVEFKGNVPTNEEPLK